jgi:hypothetical protein
VLNAGETDHDRAVSVHALDKALVASRQKAETLEETSFSMTARASHA